MAGGLFQRAAAEGVAGAVGIDRSVMGATDPGGTHLREVEVAHRHRLHAQSRGGRRGAGEAGAIGSPPAFIHALTDALGVPDIAMPATVERVWRAANGLPA